MLAYVGLLAVTVYTYDRKLYRCYRIHTMMDSTGQEEDNPSMGLYSHMDLKV